MFIKRLKETGMAIKEIKEYADLRYQGDMTMQSRLDMLTKHRLFVLAEKKKWDDNLKHLDDKIRIYEENLNGDFLLGDNRAVQAETS